MAVQRVLMLCTQSLLSEGLKGVFDRVEDMELLGPWNPDSDVLIRFPDAKPDVVLFVVEESGHGAVSALTAQILEFFPDLPVIHVGAAQREVRVLTSHTLPARTADLLDTIRDLKTPRGTQTAGSRL